MGSGERERERGIETSMSVGRGEENGGKDKKATRNPQQRFAEKGRAARGRKAARPTGGKKSGGLASFCFPSFAR